MAYVRTLVMRAAAAERLRAAHAAGKFAKVRKYHTEAERLAAIRESKRRSAQRRRSKQHADTRRKYRTEAQRLEAHREVARAYARRKSAERRAALVAAFDIAQANQRVEAALVRGADAFNAFDGFRARQRLSSVQPAIHPLECWYHEGAAA